MIFLHVIFYIFALTAILSGMMVIAARNPVHGVLFLVMSFVATSGIWVILHAEFLALILVLVYVGAVMTLFLFVVMMLSIRLETIQASFVRYLPISLLIMTLLIGVIITAEGPKHFGLAEMPVPPLKGPEYNNIADLGMVLYTQFAFPFEAASVLLLTAIIAAISLTHRKAQNRKSQNAAKQIAVRPKDRLRIIDLREGK